MKKTPTHLGRSHYGIAPRRHCPDCGHPADSATGVGTDDRPKAGDFSVCIRCAHLYIFADDLTVRTPTGDEIESMPSHVRFKIEHAQAMIRRMRR
jgi:hypothetical protein